jgi:hypothetical protein
MTFLTYLHMQAHKKFRSYFSLSLFALVFIIHILSVVLLGYYGLRIFQFRLLEYMNLRINMFQTLTQMSSRDLPWG